MKKNLISLISFIVLVVILILVIGQIFIPRFKVGINQGPFYIIKGFEKVEKNTLDILFIGSSNSYESISPMELWNDLGITSYDYGISASRIHENYYFLKYAITKQSPKVIFMDVTTCFYEDKQTEPMKRRSFDYFPFSKIKIEMMNDPVFENTFEDKVSILLPLLRYHDRWNRPNIGYYNDKYEVFNKGFVISNSYNPVDKKIDNMHEEPKELELDEMNRTYLDKIIEFCKDNNLDLVLTAFPNYKDWDNNKSEAFKKYAAEKDVKFFEMNNVSDTGIDWLKDTGDKGIHTNIIGSLKATKYMEKYIQENYSFEDKRNNKKYESWNKDYIKYKEILDKEIELLKDKIKNNKIDKKRKEEA